MTNTLVITGGSKGLGWAIAEKYLQNGWTVISGSRSTRPTIEASYQDRFRQIEMDVRDRAAHKALVGAAIAWTGQVDCFINNAGFSEWRPIAEIDEEFLNSILETNLMGYFWGSKAAAQGLKPGGSIINISSVAAIHPTPDVIPYTAAKAGLNAMTIGFAQTLGPHVRVNCIMPGSFRTDISKAWNWDLVDQGMKRIAMKRVGEPHEIVGAALFLASDASSYMTGSVFTVDGGIPT